MFHVIFTPQMVIFYKIILLNLSSWLLKSFIMKNSCKEYENQTSYYRCEIYCLPAMSFLIIKRGNEICYDIYMSKLVLEWRAKHII